ncbi:Gfo/Idh/MocA family oxidoreductase [Akkermansiaceae bacterium]|nr:Gfo/Idh/MocA family oxidoreductase [Akkermansiaceae bacterium]MDA8980639.1 Gfo/Idh/MocA family oxidoreductase [bacterium]MDA7863526.1 Gfo/Idh/MocA family oxidoreductase [Akkermansiaceae bacterium]MDB0056235.1 Gfo/Idh/MocA family oxidoreductase [Akkermansiaceae bacterium]MDB4268084.1 Gfo/Idh/MocA family oxidoreductase [Akkermansiaceae bacterium]
MSTQTIGIILNGVTGRMGTNQHLVRSILAIREQGGVKLDDGTTLMPDPILTGRNEEKLAVLAKEHGVEKWSTDIDAVLADDSYEIFFDASGTPYRIPFLERAIAAGKHIYCEKPTATLASEAYRIADVAEAAGVKNGTVQDKLWLPGILAFKKLKEEGFFGEILSVRGEFGYWVFSGHDEAQPAQRPSWNYRNEDGGGIIIDMHCHWRYVIDNLFGEVTDVFTHAATHLLERIGEDGKPYKCTADDAAYALFKTKTGIICQFNSSWDTRVRRDDLLTMQVDGTKGSAIVGLRKCWAQSLEDTPRPVWNPDVDSPIDYNANWKIIDPGPCENAFKVQWELFLKHIARDEPFPWSLREGAKGVELAEKSLTSHEEGRWVEV